MAGTDTRFANRALSFFTAHFFRLLDLSLQEPRDTTLEEHLGAMLHTAPLLEATKIAAAFQCQKQLAVS